MKYLVSKLFHFHRIFKNEGRRGGSSEPHLDPPMDYRKYIFEQTDKPCSNMLVDYHTHALSVSRNIVTSIKGANVCVFKYYYIALSNKCLNFAIKDEELSCQCHNAYASIFDRHAYSVAFTAQT